MIKRKTIKANNLLNQSEAVENYLDELLANVDKPVSTSGESFIERNPAILLRSDFLTPPSKEKPPDQPALEPKPKLKRNSAIVDLSKESLAKVAEVDEPKKGNEHLYDDFDFPLQCLMFKVRGHLLSVPLIKMGSVVPWTDKLTQIPQASAWFMGLLNHRETNVQVVDTAKLLNISESKNQPEPAHFLIFGEEKWAISCDQLGDVVTLQKDDIKWQQPNQSNFMLGTIKDSLAMLLNPSGIAEVLNCNKKLSLG